MENLKTDENKSHYLSFINKLKKFYESLADERLCDLTNNLENSNFILNLMLLLIKTMNLKKIRLTLFLTKN